MLDLWHSYVKLLCWTPPQGVWSGVAQLSQRLVNSVSIGAAPADFRSRAPTWSIYDHRDAHANCCLWHSQEHESNQPW
jgi:hypothetical protein